MYNSTQIMHVGLYMYMGLRSVINDNKLKDYNKECVFYVQ